MYVSLNIHYTLVKFQTNTPDKMLKKDILSVVCFKTNFPNQPFFVVGRKKTFHNDAKTYLRDNVVSLTAKFNMLLC